MMQSLQRSFTRHYMMNSSRAAMSLTQLQSASFAKSTIEKKATGDEKQFINKEEEKLLKGLLKKMKEEASETPEQRISEEKAELKKLCSDHGIKYEESFAEALMHWKLSQ
eukprot:403373192